LGLGQLVHALVAEHHHQPHQDEHAIAAHEEPQQWEPSLGLKVLDFLNWRHVWLTYSLNELAIEGVQPLHLDATLDSLVHNKHGEEVVIGNGLYDMHATAQVGAT